MTTRRKFLTTASIGGAAALASPAIVQAQSTIKWRFQTYAGGALGCLLYTSPSPRDS